MVQIIIWAIIGCYVAILIEKAIHKK